LYLSTGVGFMKDRIYYHRAYRKVDIGGTLALVKIFAFVLIIDVLIVKFHPQITYLIALAVDGVLSAAGYSPTTVITDWPLLYRKIYLVDMSVSYPTPFFSSIVFLLSVLAMLILPTIKKIPKSVSIFICYLCVINMVSATFFVFVPYKFPYSSLIFSDLYMKTEIGVWILMPLILALALHPVPTRTIEKYSLIVGIELYTIFFAAVRYAVFLYVFREYSVLFMAVLFFAFGPLFDFVNAVGFYSLYMNNVAKRFARSQERWQWLL